MAGAPSVSIGDAPDRGAREGRLASGGSLPGELRGSGLCGEALDIGEENRGEEGIGGAVREGGDGAEASARGREHGSEGEAGGGGGYGREGREGKEREASRPP